MMLRRKARPRNRSQSAMTSPRRAAAAEKLERQEKAQENRRFVHYDIGDTLVNPRSDRMYEQFLLFGTTEESGDVLETLFSYPYDLPDTQNYAEAIKSTCAVEGKTRGVSARYTDSFFSPLQYNKNGFVMTLNCNTRVLYAVCVANSEPWDYFLTDSSNYYAQHEEDRCWSPEDTDHNREDVVISIRYYCLVTANTCLSTHFNLLHDIIDREKLNFNQRMNMYEQLGDGSNASVMYMLREYYLKLVPPPDKGLSFRIQHNIRDTHFFIPSADSREMLACWCLPLLRTLLCSDDIMWLLGYLLQEYTVLVHSTLPSDTSKLVLAMVVLMKPYAWPGIVCTVLSPKMIEMIHCPVPLLAGVLDPDIGIQQCPPNVVHLIVNRERSRCVLHHPAEQLVPDWCLPHSSELRKQLENVPASEPRALAQLFKHYHLEAVYTLARRVSIEKLFDGSCLTVNINEWIYSERVKNTRERKFWERVLPSQHMSVYSELLTSAFIAVNGVRSSRVSMKMTKERKKAAALAAIENVLFPIELYKEIGIPQELKRSRSMITVLK